MKQLIAIPLALTILLAACGARVVSEPAPSPTVPPVESPTSTPNFPAPSTPTLEPTPIPTNLPTPTKTLPADPVWAMLGQLDRERALEDLRKLSGEEQICREEECVTIDNRLTGLRGLQWAKEYVRDELVRAGYSPELQDWSLAGHADQNIIARKPGSILPEEEIYIVAHLDGVGFHTGDRYPAADDNASGVAAVMELARVAASHNFDRTLVFFFSTGEEQGELGVKSHLDELTWDEIGMIKAVINVDMIGYDSNNDGKMELWRGQQVLSMDLSVRVAEIIGMYPIRLVPEVIVGCY